MNIYGLMLLSNTLGRSLGYLMLGIEGLSQLYRTDY
ncbi:hypothetical protein NRB20_23990 [Nocardia sp. RB20]|uniref:Uncharacterized protein n=1 Tax=Nocardia macrotermitis TaxID=2585198 RepID=A0A7K0D2Z0_9NOCA|nr:hypothetical protein [Nocardia macrotermitis]